MKHKLGRLDFQLLAVFEALLQHGNTGRAAEQLGVTQSAVSHSLARLRDLFGDPLFVRARGGLAPTPKAEVLAPSVLEIVTITRDRLFVQRHCDPLAAGRTLTLAVNDMGEFSTVPGVLERLREEAPGMNLKTVQIEPERLNDAMETGLVDLALAGPIDVPGELFQQKLYDTSFALLASADSAFSDPLTAIDYAAARHVVITTGRGDRLPLEPFLERLGVQRNALLTTPHTFMAPFIIERQRDLIATIPVTLAREATRKFAVKILRPTFELPAFPVFQFWHRRFRSDPFNLWARDLIRRSLADRGLRPL